MTIAKISQYFAGTRQMSGGVKGVRFATEQINKNLKAINNHRKYGIPYPVISKRTITFDESEKNLKKYSKPQSLHSYDKSGYNIFNISNRLNISIGGGDSKQYLDRLVTSDSNILDFGNTHKTLVLNETGKILGLGVVNRWNNHYSVIMDTSKDETLLAHFTENKSNFNVSVSKNNVDELFLIKGSESLQVIEKIFNYLQNNDKNFETIKNLGFQRNINFQDQLVPNNSFSIINTPQGYILSLNSYVVKRVFSNLGLKLSDDTAYETNRIETGHVDYCKDICGIYNPVEANLHSYFSKNYKYSKRTNLGTDFYGKESVFTSTGYFKRFSRTRVMMYSCDKGLIPPEKSKIYRNGRFLGRVTSSTSSPYLKCILAMGYIDMEKTFNTRSFSLAREMLKKVQINGNDYFIRFL